MKLGAAARLVESGIDETLNYYAFPSQHWRSLRTNNAADQKRCGPKIRWNIHAGNPEANARGRSVSRRQLYDAFGSRAPAACRWKPMGPETLYGHGPSKNPRHGGTADKLNFQV
jgi:hypothetical protein